MSNDMRIPTLVRGSQPSWTNAGCIMQLRNWMHSEDPFIYSFRNAEQRVSDRNQDYEKLVNEVLIMANDYLCTDTTAMGVRGPDGMMRNMERLCPTCTMKLLDWADALDGTASLIHHMDNHESQMFWRLVNEAHMALSALARNIRDRCLGGVVTDMSVIVGLQIDALALFVIGMKQKHSIAEPTLARTEQEAAEAIATYRQAKRREQVMSWVDEMTEHAKTVAKTMGNLTHAVKMLPIPPLPTKYAYPNHKVAKDGKFKAVNSDVITKLFPPTEAQKATRDRYLKVPV